MDYTADHTYTLAELATYARTHGYAEDAEHLQRYIGGRNMSAAIVTEGKAAHLLTECARAVRIAARKVEHLYSVPAVSVDECADYSAELAALLIGDNCGTVPDGPARGYLIRRAQGLVMNDRERRGIDFTEPSAGEAGADARLDGPLTIPAEVDAVAQALPVSETGRRALIAALVPGSRREWADFWGYSSPNAWHVTAARGRAELYSIGEDVIRRAIRDAEAETSDDLDETERDGRILTEGMMQNA